MTTERPKLQLWDLQERRPLTRVEAAALYSRLVVLELVPGSDEILLRELEPGGRVYSIRCADDPLGPLQGRSH